MHKRYSIIALITQLLQQTTHFPKFFYGLKAYSQFKSTSKGHFQAFDHQILVKNIDIAIKEVTLLASKLANLIVISSKLINSIINLMKS